MNWSKSSARRSPLTPRKMMSSLHRRSNSGSSQDHLLPLVGADDTPTKPRRTSRVAGGLALVCLGLVLLAAGATGGAASSRRLAFPDSRRSPTPGVVGVGVQDCSGVIGGELYPPTMSLAIVLENWPAERFDAPPERVFRGVCRFDFGKRDDRAAAAAYRDARRPFLISNVPSLDAAVDAWADASALEGRLGRRTAYGVVGGDGELTFAAWLKSAAAREDSPARFDRATLAFEAPPRGDEAPASRGFSDVVAAAVDVTLGRAPDWDWLWRDLRLFSQSSRDGDFFVPEATAAAADGLRCRLAPRGSTRYGPSWTTAGAFHAQLRGRSRVVLAAPESACMTGLYGADVRLDAAPPEYPASQARAHEVVLAEGDVLFVPEHHAILYDVDLDATARCETTNGFPAVAAETPC